MLQNLSIGDLVKVTTICDKDKVDESLTCYIGLFGVVTTKTSQYFRVKFPNEPFGVLFYREELELWYQT